jgi:hypothetical protein
MFRTALLLISTVLCTSYANAVVKVEKTEYKGWKSIAFASRREFVACRLWQTIMHGKGAGSRN